MVTLYRVTYMQLTNKKKKKSNLIKGSLGRWKILKRRNYQPFVGYSCDQTWFKKHARYGKDFVKSLSQLTLYKLYKTNLWMKVYFTQVKAFFTFKVYVTFGIGHMVWIKYMLFLFNLYRVWSTIHSKLFQKTLPLLRR